MWKFLQYSNCKITNYLKDIAFVLFMIGALIVWASHIIGFYCILTGGLLCSMGTLIDKFKHLWRK